MDHPQLGRAELVAPVGRASFEVPAGSFDAWVADHLTVLAAIAVREVGRADCPDVVQECLLRAWQRWETFDSQRGSARSWLVAILLERCRRHRLRQPKPFRPLNLGDVPAPAEDRLLVEGAVRRLPKRQRQVVTLFYLADLPVRDIAVALAITESTVKTALHDARNTLRDLLEQR